MRCFTYFLAILIAAVIAAGSNGCTTEEETVVHEGNQPLPDTLVSDIHVEAYVNKTYINLLGRKPDDAEFAAAYDPLIAQNASVPARKAMLETLQNTDEYFRRIYDVARINLLANADSAYFQLQLENLNRLREDPRYEDFIYLIDIEIAEIEAWLASPQDLRNGDITITEMYRRFVNNLVYDEINMGTENFVLSLYESFLGREPTGAELDAAKLMVDGRSAVVFLEQGTNKDEFLDVFFNSRAYQEGRVRSMYLTYLFREPDAVEIERYASLLNETGSILELQKEILSLDEYLHN